MPTDAVSQTMAAVVSPRTLSRRTKIRPPPIKPMPETTCAAEVLDVSPGECLAVEDSLNGIRAAHAAGMMPVMVPDLLQPTEEIRAMCVRVVAARQSG